MKTLNKLILTLLIASVCMASAVPSDPAVGESVVLGGATWGPDFEAAQAEAEQTGKPILLFDMVGRLDEKWC
jgi:hypothetical protein